MYTLWHYDMSLVKKSSILNKFFPQQGLKTDEVDDFSGSIDELKQVFHANQRLMTGFSLSALPHLVSGNAAVDVSLKREVRNLKVYLVCIEVTLKGGLQFVFYTIEPNYKAYYLSGILTKIDFNWDNN